METRVTKKALLIELKETGICNTKNFEIKEVVPTIDGVTPCGYHVANEFVSAVQHPGEPPVYGVYVKVNDLPMHVCDVYTDIDAVSAVLMMEGMKNV